MVAVLTGSVFTWQNIPTYSYRLFFCLRYLDTIGLYKLTSFVSTSQDPPLPDVPAQVRPAVLQTAAAARRDSP